MPHKAYRAALLLFVAAGVSQAGLIYDGGFGSTVYGATDYTCPGAPGPCTAAGAQGQNAQYIANNVTGHNDILTTPGNGYQVANPVIGNNVAQTPGVILTPYVLAAAGGNGGLSGAPFGAGNTANFGPNVGFFLSDTTAGCCTASYMITSWESDYTVDAAGLNNATLNAYLGMTGVNATLNDAAVASLIVDYSINGGAFQALTPMLLAIGGNCIGNNDVLEGDAAAEINNACIDGTFSAAAVDALNNITLANGATIDFLSTLTVYADPADFDLIDSNIGTDLLPTLGLSADNIVVGDSAPTPEPGTMVLLGAGLTAAGLFRRRRKV